MISTERFLDLLEEKELLSPRAVASLRGKLPRPENRPPPSRSPNG